ncbi:hypothetical protein SLEP1_g48377 [Rubroshorea leprosula]|uniref:RRM domain-containing protein n=1 Tax=Rubroshorea leprosula TaxID=152421 RepID=A0AAV5LTJ9_9ROSI|nr:hypothetical protein SLEP1_g48377 [Rubroshorea leprosula]
MRGLERERVSWTRGRRPARGWEHSGHHDRHRRFQPDWRMDRATYNQAVPFFFTNFPDDWTHDQMWRTFCKFGRLLEVYVPDRKDKYGRRFGFARFQDVKNTKALEEELDQIKIGGLKLHVNQPRFARQSKTVTANTYGNKVGFTLKGPAEQLKVSYADALKGGSRPSQGNNLAEGSRHPSTRMTNERMWVAKDQKHGWKGWSFNVDEKEYTWVEGSYVGTARAVELIPTLQEKFYMEGYFSLSLKPMGGKLVLMQCQDKEELQYLVENAGDWLAQWFDEVRPWTPSMVASDRFTWIKCQGVPLHAWGPKFFEDLSMFWGKLITLDDSTSNKKRFDAARFLISTPCSEVISKVMTVKINGEFYNIKCVEEETTNNLFSMKSDFKFKAPSDSSDDSENWSFNSFDEALSQEGCGHFSALAGSEGEEDDDVALGNEENGDVAANQEMGEERSASQRSNYSKISNCGNLKGLTWETQISSSNMINSTFQGSSNDVPDSLQSTEVHKMSGHLMSNAGKSAGTETIEKCSGGLNSMEAIILGHVAGPETKNGKEVNWRLEQAPFKPITKSPLIHDNIRESRRNIPNTDQDRTERVNTPNADQDRAERVSKFDDELHSFLQNMDSDSGAIQEWMRARERKKSRKRCRKAKSCAEVYRESKVTSTVSRSRRGRTSKSTAAEAAQPEFMANSGNEVADDSISDSNINNRNNCILQKMKAFGATEIWDFAKSIGVVATGKEEEVLKRLEQLETRDGRQQVEDPSRKQRNDIAGEGTFQ